VPDVKVQEGKTRKNPQNQKENTEITFLMQLVCCVLLMLWLCQTAEVCLVFVPSFVGTLWTSLY